MPRIRTGRVKWILLSFFIFYAEVTDMNSDSIQMVKLVLDIFDYVSMVVFILEILLKWVDGFWEFWKNGWNNFDFFVTVMVGIY